MNAELTAAERDRILAKSALFSPPPPVTADGRRDLVGMSREELAAELAAIGEASGRCGDQFEVELREVGLWPADVR